jgi:RNA polymerase sigma factor (sigma-70 family)
MKNLKTQKKTDEQLIAQINQGDKKMLEVLFDRYIDKLLRYVNLFVKETEEAKDLTQEILTKIFQGLSAFKNKGRFEAWFFIVARRTIIDSHRKKQLKTYSYDNDKLDEAANKQHQQSEKSQTTQELLITLPNNEREILQLRFLEGLSYQEIAKAVNMSQGSVRNAVSRAIKRIQESNSNEL